MFILANFKILFSQTLTRIIGSQDRIENYLPYAFGAISIPYELPTLDYEKELAELGDEELTSIRRDVNYTKETGQIIDLENNNIYWEISFKSFNCSWLSFLVDNLSLPINAEMYLYSSDGKVLQGPITHKDIENEIYNTNILPCSDIIFRIKMPRIEYNDFRINIFAAYQGVVFNKNNRAFQGSLPCHYDVNCPVARGMELMRDATGLLIINGIQGSKLCTGTLLNNECRDFKPYFLSTFHCYDFDGDLSLSSSEKNGSIYAFRFKYESNATVLSCPGATGGTENTTTYIDFNAGSTFRTSSSNSDMAMVEISGSLLGLKDISVAGWDNSTTIPPSSGFMHHPALDVKKITLDAGSCSVNTTAITFPGLFLPIGNAFNFTLTPGSSGDIGLGEGGSSGAALFSANRVIGILSGGVPNATTCSTTSIAAFAARFRTAFWGPSSGGSSTNRLSDWLDNSTTNSAVPVTSSSIRAPWIDYANNSFVCSSTNKTITLNNSIPGKSLSWSVTNPNLFATTGGANNSGTTSVINLRAASATSSGSSTLTFTMSETGCNPIVLSVPLWIGIPGIPSTTPSGSPAVQLAVNQYKTITLTSTPGSLINLTGTWSKTGNVTMATSPNPNPSKGFTGSAIGTATFSVYAANQCGNGHVKTGNFSITNGCNPCPIIILNNPVSQEIYCEIPNIKNEVENSGENNEQKGSFELFNQQGKILKKEITSGYAHRSSIINFENGIYFVRIVLNGENYIQKIAIIND